MEHKRIKVAVIGLGYVGLPLAVHLARSFDVVGYDLNAERVLQLNHGIDSTGEVTRTQLLDNQQLTITDSPEAIARCNFYIITVPTPVDQACIPELSSIESASNLVAGILQEGDCVVYESTVYPGCTRDFCLPILERTSGLRVNKDFYIGYSPERINPGDKENSVTTVTKVVSGSNTIALELISHVYREGLKVELFPTATIEEAEFAKVLENVQRDVNIALINEVAILAGKLNIDIYNVLRAASTKWNFMCFTPGLVGGHCIGVDPYYLSYAARASGIAPGIIECGRSVNDQMHLYYASVVMKRLSRRKILNGQGKILVVGLTFKENCPDLRNSRVFNLIDELASFGIEIDLWDPLAHDSLVARGEKNVIEEPQANSYAAVIFAVPHDSLVALGKDFYLDLCSEEGGLFDLKAVFPVGDRIWRF